MTSLSFRPLSVVVQQQPKTIDAALERLSCASQGVTEVDIHPAALTTLTARASPEVQAQVQQYLQTAQPSTPWPQRTKGDGTQPPSLSASPRGGAEAGDGATVNLAVAFSVHTVLLSRNRLTCTLGLVQFKNVVRLSLLGNNIRRIEDCEPLSLLQQLAFLSLEFNPVCALPHYRAHMLRITSWPKELSLRNCRLRKLDAATVTPQDVRHAMVCLQRELSLLPELTQRHRLVDFLAHVEGTMRLHAEMRRRGVLVKDTETTTTLPRILARCSSAALGVFDFAAAAHMTRLAVGEAQRNGGDSPQAARHAPQPTALYDDGAEKANAGEGSERKNTLNALSALEVSVETRTSGDGGTVLSVLDDVSEICLEDLSWAKLSLSNAEQSQHDAVCEAWSADRFRLAISLLDVKMCTHFLKIARQLGGPALTSADVDALCRDWMHIMTHHTPVDYSSLNATGRRSRRPYTVAVQPRHGSSSTQQQRSTHVDSSTTPTTAAPSPPSPQHETVVVMGDVSGDTAVTLSQLSSITASDRNRSGGPLEKSHTALRSTPRDRTASQNTSPPATQEKCPPRAATHVLATVPERKAVGSSPSSVSTELSPRDAAPTATRLPALSQALHAAAVPRRSPPLEPLAVNAPRNQSPVRDDQQRQREPPVQPPSPASPSSCGATTLPSPSLGAPLRPRTCDGSGSDGGGIGKLTAPAVAAGALVAQDGTAAAVEVLRAWQRRRALRTVFGGLLSAFERRQQSRLCVEYRAMKIARSGGQLAALVNLRLTDDVSYIPRKGIFFQHWRERAMERGLARQLTRCAALRTWRRRTLEAQDAAAARRAAVSLLTATAFGRWKRRASEAVLQRCEAARQRVLAPHQGTTSSSTTTSPTIEQLAGAVDAASRQRAAAETVLSFERSHLKRVLEGSSRWGSPALPSPGTASCPSGGCGPSATPSPAQPEDVPCAYGVHLPSPSRRVGSLSTRAVVMPSASPARRAPSTGLVSSRAASLASGGRLTTPPEAATVDPTAESHSHSPSPSPSPFSEDDVAALVQKASALQASRGVLVQRVVDLQLECERLRVMHSHSTERSEKLQGQLTAAERSLAACETERARVAKEAERLRGCVSALREERRELLGSVLHKTTTTRAAAPAVVGE